MDVPVDLSDLDAIEEHLELVAQGKITRLGAPAPPA